MDYRNENMRFKMKGFQLIVWRMKGMFFMSEKLAEVFEQYDVQILNTKKGRGSTILSTTDGPLILEPFRGNITRLGQEYVLKGLLHEKGFRQMDDIIPNREGVLLTCDKYRQPYVLKRYFDGNECDMHNVDDMVQAIKMLATFHIYGKEVAGEFDKAWKKTLMEQEQKKIAEIREAFGNGEELEKLAQIYDIRESILREILEHDMEESENQTDCTKECETKKKDEKEVCRIFIRHNQELRKIYKYVSKVKKKNAFETLFLQIYSQFYEQGKYCEEQLQCNQECSFRTVERRHYGVCHGFFNQHNIMLTQNDGMILHFERFTKGNQLNDLYQFARKAMEKNNFDFDLLMQLLLAYDAVIPLSKQDYEYIYILFSYPEKFWKIANGYYNAKKSFLSPKHVEKLENVILQEEEKRKMLEEYFAFHFV